MTPVRVFVALGSNVEPERNFLAAMALLCKQLDVRAVSTVLHTDPAGPAGQPDFVNAMIEAYTDVSPRPLHFEVLRGIEAACGRVRSEDRFAPRPMDLDLVVYGDVVRDGDGLVLPDPDLFARAYLQHGLAELAPDWVIPGSHQTAGALFAGKQDGIRGADHALTALLRQRIGR